MSVEPRLDGTSLDFVEELKRVVREARGEQVPVHVHVLLSAKEQVGTDD